MDKYVHYSVSYALSYTGSHILPVPLRPYSPLITLVVGAIKELTDEHFDNSDMLANGLGVFTSIVVLEWE